jgi:hypothetical protein
MSATPLSPATPFSSASQCACGFGRLADEEVIDHILAAFEPADSRGTDGQVHEEWQDGTCSCGFTGASADELDEHFLAVFTPPGSLARDGRRHAPGYGSRAPMRITPAS